MAMADSSFAPGGWQDDGDAEILALFRQWIGECRIADGIEEEAPAWHEAMDQRYEIERRIASCRCGPAADFPLARLQDPKGKGAGTEA